MANELLTSTTYASCDSSGASMSDNTDSSAKKTERVSIMMSKHDLERLDDWAFSNRIRSRGEAIRRLVQMGIGRSTDAENQRSS